MLAFIFHPGVLAGTAQLGQSRVWGGDGEGGVKLRATGGSKAKNYPGLLTFLI